MTPVRAAIGLGSNLGDRAAHLGAALAFLTQAEGITLLGVSALYETPPMGPPQPDYLNAAASIETTLGPQDLLEALKGHERRAGRVVRLRWGPRPIDLDILLYGDARVEMPGLTLPHGGLAERPFVLLPLADLDPEVVPPGIGPSVGGLLEALREGPGLGVVRRLPWPEGILPEGVPLCSAGAQGGLQG